MQLFYRTDWPATHAHFCPHDDSGVWRTEATSSVPGAPGWQCVQLPASRGAEFAMCNGDKTEWDNPPPEVGAKNYSTPQEDLADSVWTLRHGKLMKVSAGPPILVVSDLDNTMVGHHVDDDNTLLKEFQALWLGRFFFGGSSLVYSTGRNKEEALSLAVERGLLRPKLLLCALGTEVYLVPDDLPLEGGHWARSAERITLEPGWTEKMKQFDRDAVLEKLKAFPQFEIERSAESDPFRVPGKVVVDEHWDENMRSVREALGPSVQVVTSGGAEWKYIDFCSHEAGKMNACLFAIESIGVPAALTLVCGDSGNDECMYRCPGVHGVVVGNALPELVDAVRGTAEPGPEAMQQGAVFRTKAGSTVLYAQRPAAGAICEALETFWPVAT